MLVFLSVLVNVILHILHHMHTKLDRGNHSAKRFKAFSTGCVWLRFCIVWRYPYSLILPFNRAQHMSACFIKWSTNYNKCWLVVSLLHRNHYDGANPVLSMPNTRSMSPIQLVDKELTSFLYKGSWRHGQWFSILVNSVFDFENVLLTFKWYVFMWQKCSMLTKYTNCHFLNKWKCVSMP